jgi:hypothetical protein
MSLKTRREQRDIYIERVIETRKTQESKGNAHVEISGEPGGGTGKEHCGGCQAVYLYLFLRTRHRFSTCVSNLSSVAENEVRVMKQSHLWARVSVRLGEES